MDEARIYAGILSTPPDVAPHGWVQRVVALLQRMLRVQAAGERRLKRVDTLTLGPRNAVHLIECDGQRFLIADGLSAPVAFRAEADEAGR